MPTRRHVSALLASGVLWPHAALSQDLDLYEIQRALINGTPEQFYAALAAIRARGNPDMAAGLITSMRFTQAPIADISAVLADITGAPDRGSWFEWMLWQERHPEIVPHPTFIRFKRDILLAIDPNFDVFLDADALHPDALGIRLEEITWGGVRKDGIPSLDFPTMIDGAEAAYLRDDDLIFGVSINGDIRAYPLRIMGWHEMFNDVIGGVPVALAYCTLCGSGILFETQIATRDAPLIFGSSGLLYRSNKLMFDRATQSLWNQFTGGPVSGPLSASGITLAQRPIVIDTWANWLRANPGTQVLSLATGHARDYGSDVVYNDYFTSSDLMFPADVDQSQLQQKDYVFGIRQFGGAKAWPLKAFGDTPVINDTLLGRALVLIGDPETRAVRAFERGDYQFTQDGAGLMSADGNRWAIQEDALESPSGQRLARVAGHIAYWFAWDSYLASSSEIYQR